MGRPSNTEQRRAEIVDALAHVMAARGWTSATITAIAEKAGLAPGLVHYHFGNKQEILLVLAERLSSALRARYEAMAAKAQGDPEGRLFAFSDAHVALGEGADPSAVAAWAAIAAEAAHTAEVREVYERAMGERLEECERLFASALRARHGSARGARESAAGLLAAIEGAYRVAASAPELLPRGFAAPALRRMIRGLLAAPGELATSSTEEGS